MKVSSNIGIINALIRITVGFTILAWATSKLVKRPWRDSYLVMAMIGAMKVGEGILRYCPVTDLFDRSGDSDGDKKFKGLGNFKAMDMFNVKDMLKSDKKKNESGNFDSFDSNKNKPESTSTKKDADFNPEELTNKEVQEALNGDLGTSSSKTSNFDNQGFTQI
ncbi:YgaP family membrane protein [Rossellomorea sp. NS-SX7]|uniref:YgaP family membrane protein n=1 Tax=Rossellomorea sp. NS-SX7 TaxID=3463856 RepID=UPI00405996B6